jgi:broad specificity phosphatase PhoE
MEIILLRHGKPDVELKGHLNASDIKQLTSAYAQSGVEDSPPEILKDRFNACYVVCSDLARSTQSAKKLGVNEIHLSDALFKETDVPHFDQGVIKMPVTVWLIVLRVMWLFGFKKNGESFSKAKNRAQDATNKLIALAQENEKVILVGHGLMNRLIAKQLRLKSWQGPPSPGKKHWEFGRYTST